MLKIITEKITFTTGLLLLFIPSLIAQIQFESTPPPISGIENHSKDQYLTDSSYFYSGVQSGTRWYNNRIFRVAQRNDAGNVIQAFDHDHDSLANTWYLQRKYEGSFLNDTIRKVWLSWVKNRQNNTWLLADSIHFNVHGEPTISWYKTWDPVANAFVGGKLSEFLYDESGILHLTYNHYYDTTDQSWERDNYEVVFYNQNNQDSLRQIFYWNGLSWIKDQQISYTYTPKLYLAEALQKSWNGVAWENDIKWAYIYSDELLEKTYTYSWQPDLGEWMNSRHSDYEYNPDGTTYRITDYFWDGADWLNTTRKTYTYNANQQPEEILNEFWSFGSEIWKNVSLNTYTYHTASGNREEYTFYIWNTESERWENYYREHHFQSFYPSPSVPEFSRQDFTIFPNPSKGVFNLEFNDEQTGANEKLLMVYTVDGKLIKTMRLAAEQHAVNLSGLSPGIYRLALKSGDSFSEQLLIIGQ